jgi:protein ImuB
MACVDLAAMPLQILLRRHPDWETHPVAVVDRDKPLGIIQWVNEHARACRILPGMRYAAGLSLSRELRAGVVSEVENAEEIALLARRLWCFSPRIEPSTREPGVFWLDATGLLPLYASLDTWASAIQEDLRRVGFRSVVAVGFSRFGSYAAAKTSANNIIFRSATHEQARLRAVPIDRLGIAPGLRDTLLRLGIVTVGDFAGLPSSGIRKRFGAAAHELHRLAQGTGWAPIEPQPMLEPAERSRVLESPETNLDRLLAAVEPLLQSILIQFSERQEALLSLQFFLSLDNGKELSERLSPAVPTLDANQLLSLIRLRIETLSFSSGVVELRIQGTGAPISRGQIELFPEAPRRNFPAVHRALARIRAELGNDAVVHAHLHVGHLPEACFGWEPFENLVAPKPTAVEMRPLVRRVYSPPLQLPARARHEPDGWLIAHFADGPVEEVIGPHVVSGGWWAREISRAYHYVRTRSGRWLWIYNDQKRRRWFLQGEVE